MKRYNIIFCDDDKEFLDLISLNFISSFNNIEFNIYKFLSLEQLTEFVTNKQVDVLFLDYNFKKVNSFDYLEKHNISNTTKLIIVSSFENIIYDSFKYDIFWFIRKSKLDIDLKNLISHLISVLNDENNDVIFKDSNKKLVLNKDKIRLIETHNKNNLVIHEDKQYIIRATFKSIKDIFMNDCDYIMPTYGKFINCKYIKFFNYSDSTIEMIDSTLIPISRAYKKESEKKYGEYLCK